MLQVGDGRSGDARAEGRVTSEGHPSRLLRPGTTARDSPEAGAQTLDDVEGEMKRGAMCDRVRLLTRNTLAGAFIEPSRLSVAVGTLTPLWGAGGDGRRMGVA